MVGRQHGGSRCRPCGGFVGGAGMTSGRFVKGQHWREHKPHWDKEWLVREYVTNQRSTGEIAKQIGTTDANVLYWMKKHDIARRDVSGARAVKHWGMPGSSNPMFERTGESNPNFIDGNSPERQRMYAQGIGRAFVQAVLHRDKNRCRRCGKGKSGAKSLHVHHIIPWAKNRSLRFDMSNALVLCNICHGWVHSRKNINKDYLA